MEALGHTKPITITLPDGSTRDRRVGDDARPGGGRDRPAPRERRPRRQGRRKARRPGDAPARGREDRDRHGEVAGSAGPLPPLHRAPHGERRQAALSDGPDRHRTGDRERLLLRLLAGTPLHARRSRRDRGRDAEDRGREQPGRAARDAEGRGGPDFRGPERRSESRDHPGHPGRQGLLLPPEGLHRSLPGSPRPLHRAGSASSS